MSAAAGTVVAVLLSLLSAAGYALAAVAQSRLASTSTGGRGALRRLLGRPQWWWAVGLNAAGALAHVAALHYGPLTLVQPLGALTLVAALPIGAYGARRRVTRAEWRGALWTLAGLVGLVAVTGPVEPDEALNLREALVVTAVTLLLIGLLAHRSRARTGTAARGRGLGHATASGMASGVGSALTQTLTAALARDLPGGPSGWWQTAVLAVLIAAFAVGGLLLSQAAYRGGLAAPLAVVNLSNPAAAAVIGVALLGETFRAGAWGWAVAAGASLVAARGVVLLTTGLGTEAAAGEAGPAEAGSVDGAAQVAVTDIVVTEIPAPATGSPSPVPDSPPLAVGASPAVPEPVPVRDGAGVPYAGLSFPDGLGVPDPLPEPAR
ncbi:DMT family transporter [Streptomyces sp. NPDC048018]|uniref:DMT family transporter n=1 Tax=Streptomyces sp. NPDC048018 TaxID=3365499 RepID=UPI003719D17E